MYTQYFGLTENPFSLSPDPRYLYLSRRHQEALAHLTYGINHSGGFVQLTGEVGTGKTMIVRALLVQLPKSVDVALVLYPYLSVRELMEAICEEFRIPYVKNSDSLKTLIQGLYNYLLENHAAGRRTILIIDEAQNLSHEVLEQIRLLTNLETAKQKLLQFLLIGQPELRSLLAQHNLRQLAQRITARYNLKPLSMQETCDYVRHRLQVAGARGLLFSGSALRTLHHLSNGTPRLINVICDRALLGAYAHGKSMVGPRLVRHAATEISQGLTPSHWRTALVARILLVLGLSVAGAWQFAPYVFKVLPANDISVPTANNKLGTLVQQITSTAASTPSGNPVATKADDNTTDRVDTKTVPAVAVIHPISALPLAALLIDKIIATDTNAAFTQLFSRWQIDYAATNGKTACERAEVS